VLYDDAGKIYLENAEEMKTNIVINDETAQDYDYTSSIEDMINSVKLIQKKSGSDVGKVFSKLDEASVNRYGALQHFDNSVGEEVDMEEMANQILELNNRVRRKLSISGVLGDTNVRGGSTVLLDLNLGDQIVHWHAIVDAVTHTFKNDLHTMDLEVSGKELRA
jgi:hypothetical protein